MITVFSFVMICVGVTINALMMFIGFCLGVAANTRYEQQRVLQRGGGK